MFLYHQRNIKASEIGVQVKRIRYDAVLDIFELSDNVENFYWKITHS